MINQLIALFFKRRQLVWVVALLLCVYGGYCWVNMTVEAYPEIGDVTVYVTTQVPGLAAEEVEQQITTPLERGLRNTPGLVTIRSSSTFALSLITLVFKDGVEDYWANQRVLERLASVTLPPGVQAGLGPMSGPGGEIFRYTLESDSKNLMELSEIQNWIVIPGIKEVQGVVDVNNFGGFTKEFQLQIDPEKLHQFNLTINDVSTAISNNSVNAGGGRVVRGEQGYVVRALGQIHELNDLGNVVVTQKNGSPVLVRDLGQLQIGHQEREGVVGKNDNPDTLQGIVLMLKYQNPSRVLEGLHAKVEELQKKLDPMGVKIVPYIDRDELVHLTVDKVTHTVIEGVGLVSIVLILFLGSPRSALVAAVAIPMALVAVFILMTWTKMPANLLSLGAIDFGIIVDGAIVVMETILRRREEEPNEFLTGEDVLEMTSHVAQPMFFATLIIITAYAPLLAFERAEGKLFSPMAWTVGYALFGALLCALTLIPGLAYVALRKPGKVFHNKPLIWLTNRYRDVLRYFLKFPIVAYAISGAVLFAVITLGSMAGREFLPELDEGSLWLQVDLPSGISIDKGMEMAAELRQVVLKFPEVKHIVTQLGRNDSGTDQWTPAHIEAPLGLKPYETWPDHESKAEFIRKLNAELQTLPGMSVGISQPIIDGVNDAVGGAHSPLVLRVYGADLVEDRRIADQVVDILHTIRGTASASVFQPLPLPQLVVKIDREAAARFGVNVADIANTIATGVGGAPVISVYVEDRIYNVGVRLAQEDKGSVDKIGSIMLRSSTGALIPLAQLADISLKTGETMIAHELNRRQITVRVDNRDRDLTSYLAEAQERINAEVKYDHEKFELQWAGQFENQQRAQKRLAIIMSIVLLVMAMLLFFQFGKVRQTLLILGVVPLATLGGLLAIHLTGETLNVATAVGFIALFGVSIQNAIIMVANFRRVEGEGMPLDQTILHAAAERLRPVLMTATVASIGMLPAALATGVGTDVQRGLATVVVGGLIISTFLTLFILPTLYYSVERLFQKSEAARLRRKNR